MIMTMGKVFTLFLAVVFSSSSGAAEIFNSSRHACSAAGCWPLTWILSCQKCGTTSIANDLDESKIGCFAEVAGVNEGKGIWFRKETHFFDNLTRAHAPGLKYPVTSYLELYPEHKKQDCESFMEATPSYLIHPEIAAFITRYMPPYAHTMMKFVTILREPIARDLSGYNMMRSYHFSWVPACPIKEHTTYELFAACELSAWRRIVNGTSNSQLYEKVDDMRKAFSSSGLWIGVYILHLENWFKYFHRSQFLLLNFDDVISNSPAVIANVRSFLLGDGGHGDGDEEPQKAMEELPWLNKAESPLKQRTIECDTVRALSVEVYDELNSRLYAMIEADQQEGRASSIERPFLDFVPHACV